MTLSVRSARPAVRLVAALVALAVVASLLGIGGGAGDAGAQQTDVIDDPRLDPSLAGVAVSGDGYQRARAAWRAATDRLADAQGRLARATDAVASQSTEKERLEQEIAAAQARGTAAQAEVDRLRAALRAVAVVRYVQGRSTPADGAWQGVGDATAAARGDAMVNDVSERRTDQLRYAASIVDEANGVVERDTEDLGSVADRLAESTRVRDSTAAEVDDLRASSEAARQSMRDWRLAATVAGSDLPLVALDAYVKAAGRMAAERPECGIRWWGLAGIGKVESGHGSYGGSGLTASGDTTIAIIGIPLDGANGTAVVGDTDGGRWDGDPVGDRAVGPMQFIPSSWATLGRDGNGDGQANPSNIYDAALAAAGLLCRAGGSGLDTDAGLHQAALGYNNSGYYADLVVQTARAYQAREAELIPPPPTTTTTEPAPLPEVPPTAAPPVANPSVGAPAATAPPVTAAPLAPSATPSTGPDAGLG